MTTVIRAAHYGETEDRLTKDPIVEGMARDLHEGGIHPGTIAHDEGNGTVRHEWSLRINARYRDLGGTDGGHIGAVPTAVLRNLWALEAADLLAKMDEPTAPAGDYPKTDKAAIKRTIKGLIEAGYALVSVDDGGDEDVPVTTRKEAVKAITAVSDARLYLTYADEPDARAGWVRFVLGNEPYEVVCDYTTNLEHVLGPLTRSFDPDYA